MLNQPRQQLRLVSLSVALATLAALFSLSACSDNRPTPSTDREAELEDMEPTEESDLEPEADLEPAPEPDMEQLSCEDDGDCSIGVCEGGVCEVECEALSDCGRLQVCQFGRCANRCFGPGTCFNGGVCVNGSCIPEQCEEDSDCPDDRLCRRRLCVAPDPCASDEECDEDELCLEGNCEPLPTCGGDLNCAPNEICTDGTCEPRQECVEQGDCPEDQDCIAGRCVPGLCRGAIDCPSAQVCEAGECIDPPMVGVERVIILNAPRSLNVGQRLALRAVGLDAEGQILISQGFSWRVSPEGVGEVEQSGLFTAGPNPGTALVVASWGPDRGAPIESEPLALPVLAPPPPVEEGWRVRVSDGGTGAPLPGAQVFVDGEVYLTDEEGVATFDNARDRLNVTVMRPDFDTVTVVGISARAIHLPLQPLSDDSVIAGFTGELDFSQVENPGQIELGLAGASFSDGVSQLSFLDLVGQLFFTEVDVGPISANIPLPGGLVVSGNVPLLGALDLKSRYRVIAQPGFQLGWSFGGRIGLTSILALLEGQSLSVGRVLATLLPFFDQFTHGVQVIPELVGAPPVPDVDDEDDDGDRRELVPDYSAFPEVTLQPGQAQDLRLAVDLPEVFDSEGSPITVVLSGVEVVDVGFVPLGISSTQEGGLLPMRMTPPYSGLQAGDYLVVALSARFNNRIPRNISGLMSRFGRLPEEVSLVNQFMEIPEVAAWEPAFRRVNPALPVGADLLRVSFRGGVGRWVVYFGAEALDAVRLPFSTDPETPDLTVGLDVRFDAIDLVDGVTLDQLVGEGGSGDLLQLDRFTQRFSRRVDNGR